MGERGWEKGESGWEEGDRYPPVTPHMEGRPNI